MKHLKHLKHAIAHMLEKHPETLETQYRHAAMTYLVGNYDGVGLSFSHLCWIGAHASPHAFSTSPSVMGEVDRCGIVCARMPPPCSSSVMGVSAESREGAAGRGRGG